MTTTRLRRFTADLHGFALALRNLIAPARCMVCLREDVWLHTRCRDAIRAPEPACITCGTSRARSVSCDACRADTKLTGVISAGSYQNQALRRGIHWLKFKGVRGLAGPLASLLTPHLHNIAPIEQLKIEAALVPIPLHPHRQRHRGFNQSADIARALSQQTGIPVLQALERTKPTVPQTRLSRELRNQNTENAFVPVRSPANEALERMGIQKIILLDDVTTTGSTLASAANALHTQLPHTRIWAATIARG